MDELEGLEEAFHFLDDDEPAELGESPYALPSEFLSHSQVNLYLLCGERYRRQYIERQPRGRSSNLMHGSLIHRAVEEMLRHKMRTGDVMPLDAVDAVISDELSRLNDPDTWDPKIPDIGVLEKSARELSRLYHDERLPNVRPKAVELRVSGMINDRVPFRGYIDMVEANPMDPASDEAPGTDVPPEEFGPGDCVRDLKCTGRNYGAHKVENSLQLTVYSDLVGVDFVGYDLLIETEKTRKQSYKQHDGVRSPREKEHARDVIEDVAKGISAGYFPKTDPESWMCSEKWCPFYAECRGKGAQVAVPEGLEEAM